MIKRKHMWDNALTVIMTLLCLLWVYPIALIFINSLKKEGTFTTSTVFALPTKETFAKVSLVGSAKTVEVVKVPSFFRLLMKIRAMG